MSPQTIKPLPRALKVQKMKPPGFLSSFTCSATQACWARNAGGAHLVLNSVPGQQRNEMLPAKPKVASSSTSHPKWGDGGKPSALRKRYWFEGIWQRASARHYRTAARGHEPLTPQAQIRPGTGGWNNSVLLKVKGPRKGNSVKGRKSSDFNLPAILTSPHQRAEFRLNGIGLSASLHRWA